MKYIVLLLLTFTSAFSFAASKELFTKDQKQRILGAISSGCFAGWCTDDLGATFTNIDCSQNLDGTYRCQLDFKLIESRKSPWKKEPYAGDMDLPSKYFKFAYTNGWKLYSEEEKNIYHYANCEFKGISKLSDMVTIKPNKRLPDGVEYDLTEQFYYDNLYCFSAAEQLL